MTLIEIIMQYLIVLIVINMKQIYIYIFNLIKSEIVHFIKKSYGYMYNDKFASSSQTMYKNYFKN